MSRDKTLSPVKRESSDIFLGVEHWVKLSLWLFSKNTSVMVVWWGLKFEIESFQSLLLVRPFFFIMGQ